MPVEDFDAVARRIASQVKAGGQGFITMRRDELRAAFDIGRMTDGLSDQVIDALWEHDLIVHPSPAERGHALRIYDHGHPVGKAAYAVVEPDETTDAPLRRIAELHARASAGAELRSDDVSWLEAFDMLLQLVVGREPEGWEELRDDRHGSMLAREVGEAMDLDNTTVTASWFIKLAAAVCAGRPRRRSYTTEEVVGSPAGVPAAHELTAELSARDQMMRESYDRALRAAARSVLGSDQIPTRRVELGVLGLRRRIEEQGDR